MAATISSDYLRLQQGLGEKWCLTPQIANDAFDQAMADADDLLRMHGASDYERQTYLEACRVELAAWRTKTFAEVFARRGSNAKARRCNDARRLRSDVRSRDHSCHPDDRPTSPFIAKSCHYGRCKSTSFR